jgi:hypothetical protein
MQTAEGYEALSEYEAAAHAGHRAREIAEQFGFHQVVFEAEALVRRVAQGQRTATRVAEVAVPEPLQTIVDSISKMRHLMPR